MRDAAWRLAAACLLIAVLAGMTLHYGATGVRHDRMAIDGQRLIDYEDNVGRTVFFWGDVIQADGDTMVVDAWSQTITVRTDLDPPAGSAVQIYGRLEPGHEVAPGRVIVSTAPALRYLYVISALGGLFAAAFFLRAWRVDVDELAFVPREADDD